MVKYNLTETVLYLENVTAGYDGNIILKDINIEEKDVVTEGQVTGQVIAILGRSGRGKSTLFRILTGLMKPISGTALISNIHDGQLNTAKNIEEGDIALVDQKYTLFRHKTVYQTLMYALRKSPKTKAEKEALIDASLSDWNLSGKKLNYPSELSGGQKQRVCLLEKILADNTFIVLDEPFSGLDTVAVDNVKKSIHKFKSIHEMNTVIFSTHDINLAVELADSIHIVGHPEGVTDYSTIIKKFDLKELGFAWEEFGPKHISLVSEIKEILANS